MTVREPSTYGGAYKDLVVWDAPWVASALQGASLKTGETIGSNSLELVDDHVFNSVSVKPVPVPTQNSKPRTSRVSRDACTADTRSLGLWARIGGRTLPGSLGFPGSKAHRFDP